ncbi:uncharacterized protein TNCV_4415181 [Trichonephila clavipes]|uniref:Uncharacterized protein n=1 Tax=Trichonephila clavipes TaxID=2585209 RepID=A0A8X6VFR9_TRICX|nr:uncharacterized protein TNCV_4415181 [Trichonephila clavipes]
MGTQTEKKEGIHFNKRVALSHRYAHHKEGRKFALNRARNVHNSKTQRKHFLVPGEKTIVKKIWEIKHMVAITLTPTDTDKTLKFYNEKINWRLVKKEFTKDDLRSNDRIAEEKRTAAVAEWYRHRIVAGFVTSSSPVPLKTRRVGQRCTLNLSRAEMSSRWCGVVVRRGRCQLRCRPRHLTMVQNYVVRRQKPSCS